MAWLLALLFVVGAVCGATIRLMVFAVALLGAVMIAVAATVPQGVGRAVLTGAATLVALQLGYAAGFVVRAAIRSLRTTAAVRAEREPPISAALREKHREIHHSSRMR